LVLVLHHIASDGWSMALLIRELVEAYASVRSGRVAAVSPLPIQYADYAIWQRAYLEDKILTDQLAYWEQQLSGVSSLQLPLDYPRPVVQSARGGLVRFEVDPTLTAQLRHLGHEHGATLFMTLLAAFKVLLYHYSGQEDLCVGCPTASRTRHETDDLIGFFVNALALRSRLDENDPFAALLQQVKKTTLQAYEHQDVPFEKVVELVVRKRDTGRDPLFQVFFEVAHNAMDTMDAKLEAVKIIPEPLELATVRFDLAVSLSETENGLLGRMEYRNDLFTKETITAMGAHYEQLLQSIVKAPAEKIGTLLQLQENSSYIPGISENDLFNFDFNKY
jgi:hypothetical protein